MSQQHLFASGTARFSADGRHRYELGRPLNASRRRLVFVMLNPSKAGADDDDATIRRCIGFGRSWEGGGFGWLHVGNLFSLVSTDPNGLDVDPVEARGGDENARTLGALVSAADLVVVAWGNNVLRKPIAAAAHQAVDELVRILGPKPVHAISVTKWGQPEHPLRLSKTLQPSPFDLQRCLTVIDALLGYRSAEATTPAKQPATRRKEKARNA